ncbi:MAG: SDR family NAD(P)-dependent oxidoreductase [Solirubrobacterales bacterium]|nr:SDR family NAD(P)-dependent oxidoreductase [Solirubrobacterales bacterium]
MAKRAALITGGSGGIGLAIARALGEDGYAVTISARRPEKLEAAAEGLRADGIDIHFVPALMGEEGQIVELVRSHRERFGRLDVLVNNAGVGIGEAMDQITVKKLDIQLGANLRGLIVATREALPMLREAGAEHRKALIANMASIAGKKGQGWLSVYSATKAGVVGFSQATQKECENDGIQVTALCPGFVDTDMTEFIREHVSQEDMLRPEDISEAVRYLLRTSPACLIPEIVFTRPGETL